MGEGSISDSSDDFLTAKDFSSHTFPDKHFELAASCLVIDGTRIPNPRILGFYDSTGQFRIAYEYETTQITRLIFHDEASIEFDGDTISLVTVMATHGLGRNRTEFVPRSDQACVGFGGDASSVEVVLVNAPETSRHTDTVFEFGEFRAVYEEFPRRREINKEQIALRYGKIPVGFLKLARDDGKPVSAGLALKEVAHILDFFCFVRGGYCGSVNLIGYGPISKTFLYPALTRCDRFDLPIGWYVPALRGELDGLFTLYRTAMETADGETIKRAVAFYRSSNNAAETDLPVALISSYTALEAIVPHILTSRAGWTLKLSEKRDIEFHEKLRAAATFMGLEADPLEHSPDLQERSKSYNNADGFELLSRFRNKIVHSDNKFKYELKELEDVWRMSQWLCEVFILYLLGYQGTISDRRRGSHGNIISIPIN